MSWAKVDLWMFRLQLSTGRAVKCWSLFLGQVRVVMRRSFVFSQRSCLGGSRARERRRCLGGTDFREIVALRGSTRRGSRVCEFTDTQTHRGLGESAYNMATSGSRRQLTVAADFTRIYHRLELGKGSGVKDYREAQMGAVFVRSRTGISSFRNLGMTIVGALTSRDH